MLDAATQDLIARHPLGFVATVGADGAPSLAPKGTFLVLDKTRIAFGHIRSAGTLANLGRNPAVSVNFIDVFRRKGAEVKGRATVLEGTAMADLLPQWRAVWGDLADRIKALAVIEVGYVRPLTTPPYDDGATEEEMIALYKSKFAEMYP